MKIEENHLKGFLLTIYLISIYSLLYYTYRTIEFIYTYSGSITNIWRFHIYALNFNFYDYFIKFASFFIIIKFFNQRKPKTRYILISGFTIETLWSLLYKIFKLNEESGKRLFVDLNELYLGYCYFIIYELFVYLILILYLLKSERVFLFYKVVPQDQKYKIKKIEEGFD
ncbi:hypothetical protein P3G55_23255 [Leptospira sp. 96542]|nr:hypothetical protein [Leptospira sp. 96542]